MEIRYERTCTLCGRAYKYCNSCSKDKLKPVWYNLFDRENCKDIFQALNDYNFELITKEEAAQRLNQCDLSEVDKLSENYRQEIADVLDIKNDNVNKTEAKTHGVVKKENK